MISIKDNFLKVAISSGVLTFGKYVLKSGRVSPYFFNAGLFNTGKKINDVASIYADIIADSSISFDTLFCPAYKGITLSCAVSMMLHKKYSLDISYSYNRKERKGYADTGILVGSSVKNKKVLIIDDVITSGIAIRQSIDLLLHYNAEIVGIMVAFDRQELSINDEKYSAINRNIIF